MKCHYFEMQTLITEEIYTFTSVIYHYNCLSAVRSSSHVVI